MKNTRILIVEDEKDIAQILQEYMKKEGFQATVISNGNDVLPFVKNTLLSLILLDLMLPGMDGREICREIRKFSNIPIIMLTARVEEIDRIIGLELGADDYVCKPFSPKEVVARVHAVLRRTLPDPEKNVETDSKAETNPRNVIKAGPLQLHVESRELIINGNPSYLTPNEFEILSIMLQRPGQIFSRNTLIEKVQGYDFEGYDRTIDFHIKNIRKKIAEHLPGKKIIQATYGIGYKVVI
ncbi:DNA-binding response regulator in two-component regulatory system with BaeS [Desulfamplus magnetovallimortis]|uniref:DNA-binding response regulator in two-component regulatory system with BaeS n=1 Tax=Desulfamplus magnetovallimortis TaxID=1246637 RepID=A0A1W1HHK1_9BACT|nr:response regulator transcription factor [Desulfamplus magnetovallimortis]SLM31852.1 DNA-binding response regulator in two-component regulatory system with BaeS [Desulfamplus magnetovallimortis]